MAAKGNSLLNMSTLGADSDCSFESEEDIGAVKYPTYPQAYAYEPVRSHNNNTPLQGRQDSDSDEGSQDLGDTSKQSDTGASDEENNRIGNTEWCTCGNCVVMPTITESICCNEAQLDHLMHADLDLTCIKHHRLFPMLCLERDLLEVAMLSLRDVRAGSLERPINSRYFFYVLPLS